jgi:hypothetical protein
MTVSTCSRAVAGLICGLVCSAGCSEPKPDALILADLINDSAMSLPQGNESARALDYDLKLDKPSLIVVAPPGGVDLQRLPAGTTEQQRTNLSEAAKMWPGQEFLAVIWSEGLSSGPAIGRHILAERQLAVLKPPHGKVTVSLQRDAEGRILIIALK